MEQQSQLSKYGVVLARILLVAIFLNAGFQKLMNFSGTSDFAASVVGDNLGAIAIVVAIVVEILGGLMVLVGYKARVGAWALAIFTVVTAVLFHSDWSAQGQMETFMKNISIAGGFLLIGIYGSGPFSLDGGGKKKMGSAQAPTDDMGGQQGPQM